MLMLVYLAPCGIGLGHAARSVALAKELVRRGHEVIFSTYGEAINYVKRSGFTVLGSYSLEYAHKEDGSIDLEGTIAQGPKSLYLFCRQVGAELYYTGVLNPDIVISDSRLSSSIAAIVRGIPNVLVINQLLIILPLSEKRSEKIKKAKGFVERLLLELMAEVWKKSSKIIIPDFPPPYTISKQNLIFNDDLADKVVFTGPLILKYPDELPSKKSLREKLGLEDKPLILVSPSGTKSEKRALANKLINLFKEIDIDAYIIISYGDASSREMPYKINEKIIATPWLDNKYEILKAADLLVCHGGHTTLAEGMYYGVPMLIIPSKSHTERLGNAQSIVELGMGKLLIQEGLTPETLRDAVIDLIYNQGVIESAKQVAKEISKFKAAEIAIDEILKLQEG